MREPGLGWMRAMYPVAAADWIEARRPPGPIAHHMSSGGYLIWRLFPTYPVMADGRLEVYRSRPEVLELRDSRSFAELDRTYRFGSVLVHFALFEDVFDKPVRTPNRRSRGTAGETLLDHVTPDMTVYQDEIFGPVLSVVRVDTYREAADLLEEAL